MQNTIPRHKVFVSFHHGNDEKYKNLFERYFEGYLKGIVSRSVNFGDIDPNLKTETIRQKIRDKHIRDASVIVVLIGTKTWARKHVDWEIYSGLRATEYNPRCGLLGLLLPTYPGYENNEYDPHTIPPRLYDNVESGYAIIARWTEDANSILRLIHESFELRKKHQPTLKRALFSRNRTGIRWTD